MTIYEIRDLALRTGVPDWPSFDECDTTLGVALVAGQIARLTVCAPSAQKPIWLVSVLRDDASWAIIPDDLAPLQSAEKMIPAPSPE